MKVISGKRNCNISLVIVNFSQLENFFLKFNFYFYYGPVNDRKCLKEMMIKQNVYYSVMFFENFLPV